MNTGFSSHLPRSLIIDVPEIDRQHDELFSELATLKSMSIEQNSLPLERAEALFDLLVEHCATEERLALDAGLDFRVHREKHARMLKGIRKMLNEVEHEMLDVFTLIRYIDYWFERHISEEDKGLGVALQLAEHGHLLADDFGAASARGWDESSHRAARPGQLV
jgi:hemerythrin